MDYIFNYITLRDEYCTSTDGANRVDNSVVLQNNGSIVGD